METTMQGLGVGFLGYVLPFGVHLEGQGLGE